MSNSNAEPVASSGSVSPEGALRETILSIIAREGMVDPASLRGDATLETLGLDSLEVVMILNGIEDALGIYIPVDQTLTPASTLDDLVAAVMARAEEKDKAAS
jgi:acyl carrier protein